MKDARTQIWLRLYDNTGLVSLRCGLSRTLGDNIVINCVFF